MVRFEVGAAREAGEVRAAGAEGREHWFELTPLAGDFPVERGLLTAAESAVRLPKPPRGLALLCAGGEASAVACELVADAAKGAAVALAPGYRLRGSTWQGRQPAAKATIRVVPAGIRAPGRVVHLPLLRRESGALAREVTSGRDGAFQLPELSPGRYRLEVTFPGGRVTESEIVEIRAPRRQELIEPMADRFQDVGRIVLDPGAELEVAVVDPVGEPVAGASVGVVQGRPPGTFRLLEAKSDGTGRARLSGLDGDARATLTCLAMGYARNETELEAGVASAVCRMSLLASLRGALTDEEGEPVAGRVRLAAPTEKLIVTEADGTFLIEALEPGDATLHASALGRATVRRRVSIPAGETLDLGPIALGPAGLLRGVIVDRVTSEPIEAASLFVGCPDDCSMTTSDLEGRFEILAPGEGELALDVTAEGYAEERFAVAGRRDDEEEITLRLSRGGWVRALVWDEEHDVPCRGCRLTLDGGPMEAFPPTDGEGVTQSKRVAPGVYSVSLPDIRQSLGAVVVTSGRRTREVRVDADRVTHVRLGEPTEAVEVTFEPAPPEEWLVWAEDSRGSKVAAPSAGGIYEVRRRSGELLHISLVSPGGSGSSSSRVLVGRIEATDERSHQVLALGRSGIVGSLEPGPAGAPRTLRVAEATRGEVVAVVGTDANGGFAVPWLAAGSYWLFSEGISVPFRLAAGELVQLGHLAPLAGAPD